MSLAELKEKAEALSAVERFALLDHLASLEEKEETIQETIDRRMAAMDAGHKVTQEEFERRHRESD